MYFIAEKSEKTDNKLAASEAAKQFATAVWLNFSKGDLQGNVDK